MESDSEEEDEEGDGVVVEVEQRPSSLGLQDKITERQFKHLQVSLIRLVAEVDIS